MKPSDEEEIWVPTCNGVLENSTVGITVTAAGNILVATRSAAVYRSSGNSGVWWLGVKERYAVNAMAEQEDGSLVIGTILGGLRRYVRGDDSSQRIDHGFAGSSRTITAVAVAGGNEIIAGTAEGSLYRSLDNGLAWDSISAPVGVTVGGARAIVPYGDVVYIAATNGLFKRLPGDSMLTQIPVGGGPQSFTTLSIAPGGYMAVAGDEWAWLSSDGGSAWKKLPHLADGRSFMSIVVDGEGKVYAVSKDRLNINFGGWVYFTSATESRWRDADRPTDSLGAFAIALAPDGTLYATSQTEVFRSTVPSAIPSGRQADAAAIALTVTPTPATSSTTIRFTLPRAGEATLTMSDAGGREVMRQRLGRRSAGEQTVVIDISSLTPGLYPCEIRSGEDRAAAIVHVVK